MLSVSRARSVCGARGSCVASEWWLLPARSRALPFLWYHLTPCGLLSATLCKPFLGLLWNIREASLRPTSRSRGELLVCVSAVASFCSHPMAPGDKPDFGVRTPITGRENPEIWVVSSRRAPTAPTSRDLATAAASAATASGRPLNPRRRRGRCCGAVAVPPRPRDAPPRDSSSAAMTGEQRHAKPPPTARRDGDVGLRPPCRRRWAVTR